MIQDHNQNHNRTLTRTITMSYMWQLDKASQRLVLDNTVPFQSKDLRT